VEIRYIWLLYAEAKEQIERSFGHWNTFHAQYSSRELSIDMANRLHCIANLSV
jgi:hypothetical protein